jgi:hypothetical protein
MANTAEVTVAAPPSTIDVLEQVLAMMAGLSGVATDYNKGSQLRTMVEAQGATIEQQGVGMQTLVLQALVVGAMTLFNIAPEAAIQSVGTVTFATSNLPNPPPATQAVQIPVGTLVQTAGGIQFETTEAGTLQAGASSIDIPVQAVNGGANGNVAAGAINQLISGLSYPLQVSNAAPTADGADQQSASQGLSLLASKIASLLIGSPVAIANGVAGISASGTSETVQFSTVYEPWIVNNSNEAGFTVYIDNGSGSASANLIAAVQSYLNGNQQANQPGNRPSGVPYGVQAVQPVFANVVVSGSLNGLVSTAAVSGSMADAVQSYFALAFGEPAEQPQLSAAVSNAAVGSLTSLSVTLYYASNPTTAVSAVTGLPYNRVVLQNLEIDLSASS